MTKFYLVNQLQKKTPLPCRLINHDFWASATEDITRPRLFTQVLTEEKSLEYGYLRAIFDDAIRWYGTADSKSSGIITISSLLLSFVTLADILGQSESSHKNSYAIYFLIPFVCSVMTSVILAVCALWSRLGNSSVGKMPAIFFLHIANRYSVLKESTGENEGKMYLDEEIRAKKDLILEGIATEIVILSTNLKKKYRLINLAYICVIISLALMSMIIISNFVL